MAQDRIEAHRQGVSSSNGNGSGGEALVRVRLADQNKAVVQSVVINAFGAHGVTRPTFGGIRVFRGQILCALLWRESAFISAD
jgi:hypothetical protein